MTLPARSPLIGLVTCAAVQHLGDNDRSLAKEIQREGVRALPVVWNDRAIDWRNYDLLVIRSCWDYHHHVDDFLSWLKTIEQLGVEIVNSLEIVRWNIHKSYLAGLAAQGISVAECVHVQRDGAVRLSSILETRNWNTAVVKPAISASSDGTWCVERHSVSEDRFRASVRDSDLLVQQFIPEVVSDGEWSLIFLDGAFTHAVLKRAAQGEFRVQSEFGGSAEVRVPGDDMVAWATNVARHIPAGWVYARVDLVRTADGFVLMEVECIEPELFLGLDAQARSRAAETLVRIVRRRH